MPLVVCDTGILFPALVSEEGIYRKILVVFAWGKLHHELRAIEDERAEIERILAGTPEAEVGGVWNNERIEQVRNRITRLEEQLPVMTPKDFGLVLSSPITKELEDNLVSTRSVLGNQTPEAVNQFVWAAVETATMYVAEGFDEPIPPYTEGRDPKDDPIVHTAVLSRADWILAKDEHPVESYKRPSEYIDTRSGRIHPAVGPKYFIANVLCSGYHFDDADLRSIDGRLLYSALGSR
jgi:predicted nucleic acid-binding protein